MATFTSEGDLILPGVECLFRIDRQDGSTVWKTDRPLPNTGAGGLCRVGDRVYGFEGYINTSKRLVAYDIEDGQKLYESGPLDGDADQEVPLVADSTGRIYVIRDGTGQVLALQDTGSGFDSLWTAPTATGALGTGSSANFGVGTDGSLYLVSEGGHTLARRDPETGALTGESPYLAWDLDPRITVGQDGTVYVATGTASDGKLLALSADLQILWEEGFDKCYYSGPALGYPGYLAMCGSGTSIRVYRTDTGVEEGPSAGGWRLGVAPNPTAGAFCVRNADPGCDLVLYDMSGRTVLDLGRPDAGGRLRADAGRLPAGVYCLAGRGGGAATFRLLVVAR
jgi:hypothetical protein